MNCGLLMKPAANLKPPLNSPAWSINNQSTSAPLTLSSFSLGQSPLNSPMDQMHRCPVSASISSSSDLRLFIIIVVSGLVVVVVAVWAEDHPGQQWLIVSANNCMPLSGPLQYCTAVLQCTHSESISEHIATVLCSSTNTRPIAVFSVFLRCLVSLLCHQSKKTMVEVEQQKQKQNIIGSMMGVGGAV